MPPPEVASMTSIDILKPDGTTMTVDDNPLFSYAFRDRSSQQTLGARETGRSDWSWFDEGGNLTADIRGEVMLMFKTVHDWYNFSNDARLEGAAAAHANSIEAIHNTIHGDIGGFMGVVARAGRSFISLLEAVPFTASSSDFFFFLCILLPYIPVCQPSTRFSG